MKLQSFLSALVLINYANAWLNETKSVVWVTVTTDIYTTFCPSSTKFTYGTNTYTASASQFVTITDCPCVYSQPVQKTSTNIPVPELSTTPVVSQHPSQPSSKTTSWITVTETVSEYTSFYSSSTTFVQNSRTYTVTQPTTLTITQCPCTISKTIPGTTSDAKTPAATTSPKSQESTTPLTSKSLISTPGSTSGFTIKSSSIPIGSATGHVIPPFSDLPRTSVSEKTNSQIATISKPNPSTMPSQPLQVVGSMAIKVNAKLSAIFITVIFTILL